MRESAFHSMAARDPNKLEPAYLITLAVIVLFPFCCSYFTRPTATQPVKMTMPIEATYVTAMEDSVSGRSMAHVAMRDGKWRVELGEPASDRRMVIVHDGQRTVSDPPDFSAAQLGSMDPLKILQRIEFVYSRDPRPESVALDGVLCWHAKVEANDEEGEVWVEAKSGFPKKYIAKRKSGRVMAFGFEKFTPTAPSNPRLFDVDALAPMLGP